VSFSENTHLETTYYIESRSEYSPEEIQRCWWDYDVLKDLRKRAKWEVILWEAGELKESNDFCIRGLENKTVAGLNQKRYYIIHSNREFLDVQRVLQDAGDGVPINYDVLAQTYAESSRASQAWARRMGREDEKVAKELHGTA
jgi:hypothetical protein